MAKKKQAEEKPAAENRRNVRRGSPERASGSKAADARKSPRRDVELGQKIAGLRSLLHKTGAEFGKDLGVKRARISAWEQGEVPPPEKLIRMGSLAGAGTPEQRYFWERAGFNFQALVSAYRGHSLRALEAQGAAEEYVSVPLAQSFDPESGAPIFVSEARVMLPSTRVPRPDRTVCIAIPEGIECGLWRSGDVVIVDQSLTEPRDLFGRPTVVNMSLEAANREPVLRPLAKLETADLPRLMRQERLQREINANRLGSPEVEEERETTFEEFLQRYGALAGPRVGMLHSRNLREMSASFLTEIAGDAWQMALELIGDKEKGSQCADAWPHRISVWISGNTPTEGSLSEFVRPGVEILGAAIGWLASPAGRESR
jgi:transcriptional regulator with XRE-family HTH domain